MYNLRYQLNKARQLAKDNPKAIIGFFLQHADWYNFKFSDYEFSEGVFKVQQERFVHNSGGMIQFIEKQDAENACCGYRFSHVFLNGLFEPELKGFIKSRVRSANTFTEPPGCYEEWGAIRYEPY